MNCKKCNTHIADNSLYCPKCGDRTAERAQKEKIETLQKRVMGILKDQLRTSLFLVLSICISIVAVFQIISLLNNFRSIPDGGLQFITFSLNLFTTLFCILSMVGAWKLYTSKNETVNTKDIGLFTFYPKVQRVFAVFINIGAGITSGILLILGFIGGSFLSSISDFSGSLSDTANAVEEGNSVADAFSGISQIAEMGGVIMVVLFILLAALIMVLAISYGRAWRRMVELLSAMNEVSIGNNYPRFEKKPSCAVLYVWGSIFCVGSLALLALEAGLIDILPGIATGAFMFVFALFFQDFNAKEEANRAQLAKENAKLEEINAEIDSQLRREEKEKNKSQEQMQQMMMAMMMNNMSQNKNGGMQDMMNAMKKQFQGNSSKTEK